MHDYDNQFLDKLNAWWEKYQRWVIILGVIILGSLFLIKYQQQKHARAAQKAASLGYEFIQTQDPGAKNDLAVTLIKQFPDSFYTQLAALYLVQDANERKRPQEARKILQELVQNYSARANFSETTWHAMVLARYLQMVAEQDGPPAALAILQKDQILKKYPLIYFDLLGDLQMQNKNFAAAKLAYQTAFANIPKKSIGLIPEQALSAYREWVLLKMGNLPATN